MIWTGPFVFAFCLLLTGAVLFLLVYFVIILSDLECDYLNAQQCCEKLNQWMVPRLVAHSLVMFFLTLHGHWIMAGINVPMAFWLAYELSTVPKGNMGIFDPTEIHNRGQLKRHMRDCMIHLGYYLVMFFSYLYGMIIAMLNDPIDFHEPVEGRFSHRLV